MANRKAVVLGADGRPQQLQGGDTLIADSRSGAIKAATDGATVTFDLAQSIKWKVQLGGNRTLALVNDADDMTFMLILQQDATGGRTVTWWSGILWAGGSAPTLTAGANKRDVFSFIRLSSGVYLGMAAQNF